MFFRIPNCDTYTFAYTMVTTRNLPVVANLCLAPKTIPNIKKYIFLVLFLEGKPKKMYSMWCVTVVVFYIYTCFHMFSVHMYMQQFCWYTSPEMASPAALQVFRSHLLAVLFLRLGHSWLGLIGGLVGSRVGSVTLQGNIHIPNSRVEKNFHHQTGSKSRERLATGGD